MSAHSRGVGRPVTIRDEQILEAARDLFLERGFGVSTADIAARAGVSEGSLFKRFPSKAELFMEAMHLGSVEDLVRFLERVEIQGDLRGALATVVRRLVEELRTLLPRMMMLWANVSVDQIDRGPTPPPPVRVLRALTGWIEREAERGRLRAEHPRILARALLGASIHFVFFETMRFECDVDADAFARGLADTLASGVVPGGAA